MSQLSQWIDGQWVAGGDLPFTSNNPFNHQVLAEGAWASVAQIDQAVSSAQQAFLSWSQCSLEKRIECCEQYAQRLNDHKSSLAQLIAQETGKPLWEAQTEVDAMIAKVAISIEAYHERTPTQQQEKNGTTHLLTHRPHGVLAVIGPFNFPGHIPNGHIIPALIAGNTVVFKPSEYTPIVGQAIVEHAVAAGIPENVIQCVHGQKLQAEHLIKHPQISGVLFTGSYAAGRAIHLALAGEPQKILALEMGGNNPLVVDQCEDIEAAVQQTLISAFITSGQRCTCARRLIIERSQWAQEFIELLTLSAKNIKIGAFDDDPAPFMGSLIHTQSVQQLLQTQDQLLTQGALGHLKMQVSERSEALVSPGIIDVSALQQHTDEECFGPLLKIIQVDSFDHALHIANQTRYGLSAALLSDNPQKWHQFYRTIRAGIVNYNRPTTGAASHLPFGGLGLSGNHRPSAYYAADYCAAPVATLSQPFVNKTAQSFPGLM